MLTFQESVKNEKKNLRFLTMDKILSIVNKLNVNFKNINFFQLVNSYEMYSSKIVVLRK